MRNASPLPVARIRARVRRVGLLVPALAVFVAAHFAWLAGEWGGPARRTLIADAFLLAIVLIFELLAWRTARHPALHARVRRAWRWLSLAYVLVWIGNIAWTYRDLVPGAGWLGLWGRTFVLASYLPLLAGLMVLPSVTPTARARLRFGLDLGTVLLGAGLAIWFVIAGPASGGVTAGTGGAALAVFITPAADFTVIAAIAALMLGRLDGSSRGALRLLAAGHALSVVAGLVAVWLSRSTEVGPGHWVDGLWMTSAVLLCAAADLQYRRAATPTADAARATGLGAAESAGAAEPGAFSLLPYVGVALGDALLLVVTRPWWGQRVGAAAFGTVAITTLVVARQVLALRDNRRLAAARVAQDAYFRDLIENASDVVYVVDPSGTIRFASTSAERVFGWSASAQAGTSVFASVHADDAEQARAALAGAPASGVPASGVAGQAAAPRTVVMRVRHRDGSWRVVEAVVGVLRGRAGDRVLNVRDVTERAEAEAERARLVAQRDAERAQLAYQAFHDPLTGLANRALFRDRVAHALTRAVRTPDGAAHVAVLFLDLDDFKTVNDSMGHAAGDALLVEVAARLLNATRGADTVARLGGDEFAVLLEHAHTADDAPVVAQRILDALARPVDVGSPAGGAGGTTVTVGASVGVARARPEGGPDEVLRNADVAMYTAKRRGKRHYEVFAPAMHDAAVARLALEADLRHALERGEFGLVYQPIVALPSGAVTGFEALARWQHPARGPVSPAEFIPVAEETALIVPLGRWVLDEACRQGAAWQREWPRAHDGHGMGAGAGPLVMSVNVSGRQLAEGARLVADVRAALAASGLEPAALQLEITETVMMHDTDAALAVLTALSALGVRLAIDDFGTGYSSLSYLERFPVDTLKIDKAFVDGLGAGGAESPLPEAIVRIGRTLGLNVVAEGIETGPQAARLAAFGCAQGQGYLFARPLPPDEAGRLLRPAAPAAA